MRRCSCLRELGDAQGSKVIWCRLGKRHNESGCRGDLLGAAALGRGGNVLLEWLKGDVFRYSNQGPKHVEVDGNQQLPLVRHLQCHPHGRKL